MPRGTLSAEETIGLLGGFFKEANGEVSFSNIISSEEYGGKMPPEGVYLQHPFAVIVAENSPGDKAQTLHVFASSAEKANEIRRLVCAKEIQPVRTLEEAPREIIKMLNAERRRLIKNLRK